MPTQEAVRLLRTREAETNTRGDIHEVDQDYLTLCRQTALRAAEHYGWKRISCVDAQGRVRSIEDIHQEIWAALEQSISTLQ